MEDVLQFLLTLQSYDMRLQELQKNFTEIPQTKQKLHAERNAYNQEILCARNNLQTLKLEVQKSEKELKSHEDALLSIKHKLSLMQNVHDYSIWAGKIDQEEKEISSLEELTLSRMIALEDAEKNYTIIEADRREKIEHLTHQIEQQESYILKFSENISELDSKIATIRKIVEERNPLCLQQYDITKKAIRKMPCIVSVKNDQLCGGCNIKLSELKACKFEKTNPFFIICESCARMILLPEPQDTDEESGYFGGKEEHPYPERPNFRKHQNR